MARGPKPQSAEQAARKGDAGKRAKSRAAQEAAAGATSVPTAAASGAPEWLDNDALVVWSALMPLLATMAFVKVTDHGVIGRYCTHLARWIKLNAKIVALGEVHYETASLHGKMLRHHPDFTALMKIESVLVPIEDRIGLTPAARQSLVIKAAGAGAGAGGADPNTPRPDQAPATDPHGHDLPAPDPSDLLARLHAAPTDGPAN